MELVNLTGKGVVLTGLRPVLVDGALSGLESKLPSSHRLGCWGGAAEWGLNNKGKT